MSLFRHLIFKVSLDQSQIMEQPESPQDHRRRSARGIASPKGIAGPVLPCPVWGYSLSWRARLG